MFVKEKAKHIAAELRGHAPFTVLGALLGIGFMFLFRDTAGTYGRTLFGVFHPAHVVLSAMVTASMFKIHTVKKRFWMVLVIGYFGAVGVATLSDVVIPHIGSKVFGLDAASHGQLHQHTDDGGETGHVEQKNDGLHLGFIEDWYIVNPAAIFGVLIASFLPRTKFPHAGHVLISTWASSSYLLMNMQVQMTAVVMAGIFVTLFLAVWLPCCVSDIIFPLLFVRSDIELSSPCADHDRHSHEHVQRQEARLKTQDLRHKTKD